MKFIIFGLLIGFSSFSFSAQVKKKAHVNSVRKQYAPQLFGAYEKLDITNPNTFPRLVNALQQDPIANSLYQDVMMKSSAKDASEFIHFTKSDNLFQGGNASLHVEGTDSVDTIMEDWPAITSEGKLGVERNLQGRLRLTINLNPNAEMITTYASMIHEMTHAQGYLNKVQVRPLFDVLDYSSPADYALKAVNEPGGEADAFAAEISAVIRYRNRTNADYSAFHIPITEKYFDSAGILTDRKGLSEYITYSGGGFSYMANYSRMFQDLVLSELDYVERSARILEAIPNIFNLAKEGEEAKRLRLRANLIRKKFSSSIPIAIMK